MGRGGGGGGGARGGFGGHVVVGPGALHPAYNRPNIESGFCGPNAVVGSDGTCRPVLSGPSGKKKT